MPLQPEEYEKLGSYALIGLPTELYEKRSALAGQYLLHSKYAELTGPQGERGRPHHVQCNPKAGTLRMAR